MQEFKLSPRAHEAFRDNPSRAKGAIVALATEALRSPAESQTGLFLLEGSVRVNREVIAIGEDTVWNTRFAPSFALDTREERAVAGAISALSAEIDQKGAGVLAQYPACEEGSTLGALLRGPSPDRRGVVHENSPLPRNPAYVF